MYFLKILKKLTFISALRWRSAVRYPDGTVIKIRAWGHQHILVRKCPADLETVEEIMFLKVYDAALSQLRECNVFVDLGANIGLSCVMLRDRFPKARILAFEPHPGNFEMLKRNAPFAEAFQAAAWSGESGVTLEGRADGYNGFQSREGGSTPTYSMQQIVSLAGNEIDFLKVDIEGAETEVFRNPSWLRSVKVLAIEFHGDSREKCRFDDVIQHYGMRVVSESKHTTVATRQ